MARRTGLFGGSFDPIHFGHLILAREAMERLSLDRVVFIPAAISPHKLDTPPSPADARLEMVRAAVEGEPGFEVEDCEFRREGPSFTVDTVRWMRERNPDDELFYFIGDDNLAKLHTWHGFDALAAMVRFVVLTRHEDVPDCPYPVIARRIDISSTDVRNRVARGLSVRYLLPESACEVIYRRGLYERG